MIELSENKTTYTIVDLTKNEDVKCIHNELSTIIYFDINGKLKYEIRYKGVEWELTREIYCQKCGRYMGIYALLRKRVPCLCAECNKEGIPIRLNKRQMKRIKVN